MKSFYRWVSEHSGLCRGVLFLGLLAFTIYAASFEYVSFLSVYLVDLVIWFFAGRFIAIAPAKLLREPMDILDQQCDPYPMLEEMQRQISRPDQTARGQLTLVNYCLALRMTGEYHKAAQILEDLNIDRFPNTSPYFKYIYYHNLSDILYILDRKEEARIWHRKSQQIYRDLPESKAKQELSASYQMMEAEVLCYQGDYDQALRKAAWIKCPHQRMLLDAAMVAAKCHIGLEETDKAKEKLQFVIDRGNRLHLVEEARALLETLN